MVEKGTTHGTVTDIDGKFSIQTQHPDAVLVFTFIGYEQQEHKASARMQITLHENSTDLEEVVVTGMNSIDK